MYALTSSNQKKNSRDALWVTNCDYNNCGYEIKKKPLNTKAKKNVRGKNA